MLNGLFPKQVASEACNRLPITLPNAPTPIQMDQCESVQRTSGVEAILPVVGNPVHTRIPVWCRIFTTNRAVSFVPKWPDAGVGCKPHLAVSGNYLFAARVAVPLTTHRAH
jgi:hypothetical protein